MQTRDKSPDAASHLTALIKKLLLIFWEIVPKTSGDGKLLQEMILVCDAYRCVFSSYYN